MNLFGKKKKSGCCDIEIIEETAETAKNSCGCGAEAAGSLVKVLGTGCAKCNKLEANTKEALSKLGRSDINIEHVTDIRDIAAFGVMMTPALVINGKVKSVGKVLSSEEAYSLLQQNL